MFSRIVGMGKSGLLPPEQLSALNAAIKMGTLGAGKLAFVCCTLFCAPYCTFPSFLDRNIEEVLHPDNREESTAGVIDFLLGE
jgi:hypothetical protein